MGNSKNPKFVLINLLDFFTCRDENDVKFKTFVEIETLYKKGLKIKNLLPIFCT